MERDRQLHHQLFQERGFEVPKGGNQSPAIFKSLEQDLGVDKTYIQLYPSLSCI